jgi:hypothetical protein
MPAAFAQDMPPILAEATAPIPSASAPVIPPAAPAPAQPAAQAPAPASPAAPAKLSQEQLEQLLAPIALYPDQLLGQVLMASTYPLEVVEAARWVRDPANQALKGEALANAVKAKGWDPSVMALVPFRDVLAAIDGRLDWLRQLGGAFVVQQADVMQAVQQLRHLALAAGTLKTTPECHCTVATVGQTITIAAVEPGPVCVPVYGTRVAYGTWPHPAYPPVAFPVPVGVVYPPGIAVGFYPPIDIALFGPVWGWDTIDWGAGRIIVDSGRYRVLAGRDPGFAGGVWEHDPGRAGAVGALRAAAVGAVAGAAIIQHAVAGHAFRGGALSHATVFRGAHGFGGHAFAARGGRFGGGRFAGGGFHASGFHGGGFHGGGFHGGGFHGGGFHGGGFHASGFHGGGFHGGGAHFGGGHFAMGGGHHGR